ncbi:MAG TPA: error-prone DNA polymerase [Candidatus Stackebrandtia faecavium]|nr:error-prone DNA polymerase [Candidatus Stackebrandtia faecavium]
MTDDIAYAELHCHSHFSFADGTDSPHDLVDEAVRLGLSGLAITDHDGYYGVAQFSDAATRAGLPSVFGAELVVEASAPRRGSPDPGGTHLVVLARDPAGYRRLSRAITRAQLAGGKGMPKYDLERLAEILGGRCVILTGCRNGAVPSALETGGVAEAAAELDRLIGVFGRNNVMVELTHHDLPGDDDRIDALAELARRHRVSTVATNNVHYAAPSRRQLAQVLAASRSRRCLDDLDGWLPAAASAHLRSPAEMVARFSTHLDSVRRAHELAQECAFDLSLLSPALPDYDVPPGHSEFSYLSTLTLDGAKDRYGSPGDADADEAYLQLGHELRVIEKLGFAGYFLIVTDIVAFAIRQGILCQGRGSAANSAVCYALGITKVDAVKFGLLFERFLSPERDGPPDIDIDIESGRREEVIQYVYRKYGRRNAAQVANVIAYRPRSAVRDVAKALGYEEQQALQWSKQIDRSHQLDSDVDEIPEVVSRLSSDLLLTPRHLGLHPGGMVICQRPVSDFCPVEWARADGRSVLQWDKDDCARAGLVKFDLLGLGMLSALRYALEFIEVHHEDTVDLAMLPQYDPDVYAMLQKADTVGVFQVESRAQMATLPRLKPKNFYDLVVEVALIRPGPIQGGAVHPYLLRRQEWERHGTESWRKRVHHRLHGALEKTFGVPLFQEQLMQMAIDAAGFDANHADLLRRAMGSKRSAEKMERLKKSLYAGMAERDITGAEADEIYQQLAAFADFGFPESHAASFAYIVYASAWLKCHYPAAFTAAIINAQPMGFYSINTLVADAKRHGVEVRRPDINASGVKAVLESCDTPVRSPWYGAAAVRLGLSQVRGLNAKVAHRVVAHQPYRDIADVARRAHLSQQHLEALATADAFRCFDIDRRTALWAAGAAARQRPDTLAGTEVGLEAPYLPGMSDAELAGADFWAMGLSPDTHPMQFVRDTLAAEGVRSVAATWRSVSGERIWVAGIVTHRQRPQTANGTTFINLEDETGMLNVVCSQGLWRRHRKVARTAVAMKVRGVVESASGVVSLVADKLEPIELVFNPKASRDFR